jgi:hypothetical protein
MLEPSPPSRTKVKAIDQKYWILVSFVKKETYPVGRPITHPQTAGDLHMSGRGCVDYFPLILTDRFWNLDLVDETV